MIFFNVIIFLIATGLYATVHLFKTRKKLQTQANFISSTLFVSGAILAFGVMPLSTATLCFSSLRDNKTLRATESYLEIMYIIANIKNIRMISTLTALQLRKQRPIRKSIILLGMIISAFVSISFPSFLVIVGLKYDRIVVGILIASSVFMGFLILCVSYGFVGYEISKSRKRLHSTGNISNQQSYAGRVKKTNRNLPILTLQPI